MDLTPHSLNFSAASRLFSAASPVKLVIERKPAVFPFDSILLNVALSGGDHFILRSSWTSRTSPSLRICNVT